MALWWFERWCERSEVFLSPFGAPCVSEMSPIDVVGGEGVGTGVFEASESTGDVCERFGSTVWTVASTRRGGGGGGGGV